MRKIAILSIVTASLLLIGCGQGNNSEATKAEQPAKTQVETKKAEESMADKAQKAVESVKEKASEVANKTAETAKKVTEHVAQKANEAVEKGKEAVKNAVEKTKEVADNAKKAVAEATKPAEKASAPAVYAKCAGCHGKDGKMKALGKSEVIAGQSKDDLVKKIKEYKAGTRNVAGMGALMKGQVSSLSDADIDAIATYLSNLK
jgi:cytochrome c553